MSPLEKQHRDELLQVRAQMYVLKEREQELKMVIATFEAQRQAEAQRLADQEAEARAEGNAGTAGES